MENFNKLTNESLNELSFQAYQTAKSKGWWDDPRETGTLLALIHSEVSEALEEWRKYGDDVLWIDSPGYSRIREDGKLEGFWSEIADILIRCFDLAGRYNVDIAGIVESKMEFNKQREFKHGGKHA